MCPPNPFYFLFMSLIKYKLDSMLNIYQITPHSNKPFVFGVLKKGFFVGDNEEHFVTKVREGARLGSGRLIKIYVDNKVTLGKRKRSINHVYLTEPFKNAVLTSSAREHTQSHGSQSPHKRKYAWWDSPVYILSLWFQVF